MSTVSPFAPYSNTLLKLRVKESNFLIQTKTLDARFSQANVFEYGVLKLAVVKSTRIACQHMGLIALACPIHIFLHFVFSVYLLARPY